MSHPLTDPLAPVVVGVDGSECSEMAVRWAVGACLREKRPLRVVSAVGSVPYAYAPTAAMTTDIVMEAMQADARRAVEAAVDLVRELAPELEVDGKVLGGSPQLALRHASAEAGKLVVGRRGIGGARGLLLGSVSGDAAAHAECPVVVVGGPAPASGPVVVGVDPSPISANAVAHAFQQADLLGTTLVAVHGVGISTSSTLGLDAVERLRGDAEEIVGELLAGHSEDYPDVQVEQRIGVGPAAAEIIDAAESAQLVIVGSRGRGGFRGLLLGSTSRAVIQLAPCPVMVTHTAPARRNR